MKTCTIVIVLLGLLLSSCGKHSSSSTTPKVMRIDQQEVDTILNHQTFTCASLGGSCPHNIGRIFILDPNVPNESKVCTGFLLSATRFMTNNHCVASEDECVNTYISIYPGNESAHCASLVTTVVDGSSNANKVRDFTVMELDHPIRAAPVTLATTSPVAGDSVRVWAIDQFTLFESRVIELSCNVDGVPNSIEMKNCPVIQGNSGSPVMNALGQVAAILWGGTARTVFEQTPLPERRKANEFGYATDVKFFAPYAQ